MKKKIVSMLLVAAMPDWAIPSDDQLDEFTKRDWN